MNRLAELDALVATHDLNTHAFYQAWRQGTLPVAKLTDYAGEYEAFIGSLPRGWDTLGEDAYANEERAHAAMWATFRSALGGTAACRHAESRDLVATAERLFSDRATAIGALYAFEAQQPRTAESKLAGLDAHYALAEPAKRYFAVHAGDTHEAEKLAGMAQTLTPEEFARAANACESMCVAMWRALDGVYGTETCAATASV